MRYTVKLIVAVGGLWIAGATLAFGQIVPINVSGYNQDIVVEAGAPTNASGVFTATMDGGATTPTGGTWYERGFNASAPTTGLPVKGSTIVSLAAANHSYTFPGSYGPGNGLPGTTPCAFVVGQGSGTPTISLTTPAAYSLLSLIGSAGHGPVTVSYIINHADLTTEIGNLSVGDWFNGTPFAYNSNGRLTVNTGAFDNVNAGNPRLYTFDITLSNTLSPVTGMTLSSTSTTGTAAFFALSGTVVPEPSSAALLGLAGFVGYGYCRFRRPAA